METGHIIAIVAIVIPIPTTIAIIAYKKRKKRKGQLYAGGKRFSDMGPEDILGYRGRKKRGFNPYYYERDFDRSIMEKIDNGENVLVIGRPLAGKTRAVYEALKSIKPSPEVIIPSRDAKRFEDFPIPSDLSGHIRRFILIDDIDKFSGKEGFTTVLQQCERKGIPIIATCRRGPEFKQFCDQMEREMPLFGKPIEIYRLPEEEAMRVAKKIDAKFPGGFDGTIGSIFVDLETMRTRYDGCSNVEKAILKSIKRLYDAGVYRGKEIFSIDRIKHVCLKKDEIEKKKYEWNSLFESLQKKAFFDILKSDKIRTEETYLQQIIPGSFDSPDDLENLATLFPNDFDALFDIADRAGNLGDVSLEKAAYKRTAINNYRICLALKIKEKSPEDSAMTQNNLGVAYGTLADVENKAENCRKAIDAYQQALKVGTLDTFPMYYAMTQNNLGSAHRTLAEVENKPENCRKAIDAFQQALKVYTLDRFPTDYAGTQNNLGTAYGTLAEVENKPENCRKAIDAFQQALKVRTLDRLPMDYAGTQNNLGNAYTTLADVENKAENCRNAIDVLQKALKVRTLDRFPMDYAMTQNNLGTAYGTLAVVENKPENCRKAIDAYQQALKVYTLDRFPMDYAMMQNNLGNAFRRLAEVENKPENCRNAIDAYQQALKVRTIDRFPMDYAMTQNNLGNAYGTLADVENKAENCRKARHAYEEALKIYTEDKFPEPYNRVMGNINILNRFCAEE